MTNQTIIEDLTLIPPPPWWQSPWAWLAAVVIAGGIYYIWKRRRRAVAFTPPPVSTPGPAAHEEALRLLAALKARHAQMSAYEVAIECSGILRRYLEARLGLPVACQTTREFLAGAPATLPGDWRGSLEGFLNFFDGVKFARETASANQTLAAIEGCERFVRGSSAGIAPAQKG